MKRRRLPAGTADTSPDLCLCLNNLAHVLGNNGEYEAAIVALTESAELSQAVGYPHGTLSAMNMMGVYYKSLDKLEKAEAIFEELVTRCRGAATQSRLAQAVNNLGALYKQQGKLVKAHPYLQEAVRLYEAVGQIHYAAFVTVMLGEIAVARGDLDRARRSYRQVLETVREIEMPSLALSALSLLGRLLSAQGEDTRAVSVLAFVAHHPATMADVKDEVQSALQELGARMPAQDFATARERGEAWTLEEIVLQKSGLTWAGS
jgi:tetratricopeptide (TPR) repeat protein